MGDLLKGEGGALAQHTESAFAAMAEEMLLHGGWHSGSNSEWDVEIALFSARVLEFLEETQPKLWAEMKKQLGGELERELIRILIKELDLKGALHILRHGFKFYGKKFRLAYFKPAHSLNEETLALYAKNDLTVTREVLCMPGKSYRLDMVLAVNGLPVATCELKNPRTGQTWRSAVQQYQSSRDPRAPIFKFKSRSLVHFAVDPDEVHMTTHLQGKKTSFLPFNRGSHPGEVKCGAGNPITSSGYRTSYFWQEVLQRDSFLEILGNFMFIEKRENRTNNKRNERRQSHEEVIIFPRYHQLNTIRKIVDAAKREGAGHNYLIQHSAGSGKTNSISWLSHNLSSLHDSEDKKKFDCVIVISDRRVLDRQLQNAIYQIEHVQGVVKAIERDSRQLAEALVDGTKIVITTLQKFPFVLRGLLYMAGVQRREEATEVERQQATTWEQQIAGRKYAIIVDEAHSSQTGETARELKEILGVKTGELEEGESDWEDRLNQVIQSRGRQLNLSFFAFTATPKGKTIELFGRRDASRRPGPFHIYSMRQAIEEGFIMDVLGNYTTYNTYYKLLKKVSDDPEFPKRQTARELSKFMSLHPHNIEQKTEVIVEHFRRNVMRHLGGMAKAMVVTSSRVNAVRYKLSFDHYIAEKDYSDIRSLVAFSGQVTDSVTGKSYTEPGMNLDIKSQAPISESQLPARFDSPDYQILLVANKYQTGFDQPYLQAMYVDKRLDGVQAVQTLSRLNRLIPGKPTPFVLDFVNSAENIYRAFKPYYDKTELREESDPGKLEELKLALDQAQVYYWSEVEAFARIFYKPKNRQMSSDHAWMEKHIQPAVDRFGSIEDDDQQLDFREKLGAYIRVYSFLSQIIPFSDQEMEMLYSYGRALLPHLPLRRGEPVISLGDEVALEYYRLQPAFSGSIQVREGEDILVNSPTDVGTGRVSDEKAPLSEIIRILNERFGTDFTDEDRLFFEQIREKARRDEQIIQTAKANPLDKFKLGIRRLIEDLMVERMSENDEIVSRYMEDSEFQNIAFPVLAEAIFEAIKSDLAKTREAATLQQNEEE